MPLPLYEKLIITYDSYQDQMCIRDSPYGNGSYRMLVLLPNEGKNIQEIMKGLDEEKLNQISQNMENCMVCLLYTSRCV